MEQPAVQKQMSKPTEGNIVFESPRVPATGKKNSSAKMRKEAPAPAKDGLDTADTSNETVAMKARKRTKTGCLSKPWLRVLLITLS